MANTEAEGVRGLRIGVGVHAHWVVDFDVYFNHSYIFQHWVQKYDIWMMGYKGLLAADARELMVGTAIEQGCSHLLVLDADHIIPEALLDLLLESKDEAMVSGLVCRRFYPFDQVAYGKIDRDDSFIPIEVDMNGSVYEVGACAFGCTLINLEKIQKLEKPWFRDTCEKRKDGSYRNMRSDINLCDAFRAAGEKVWIDSRVLVLHVGSNILVSPQNHKFLKNIKPVYEDSFKLREGMGTGFYKLPSRLL